MAEHSLTKHEELWAKADCELLWQVNRKCNFDCVYCFREVIDDGLDKRTEDPACGKFSPEHIAKRFDETNRVWRINMTGGEPFLYPNFVELARVLTRRHYISVSTNLSTANTYEFADVIDNTRVHWLKANVHIMEREKIRNGVNEFLRKFLHFQQQGFDIRLVYVTYPAILGRIRDDLERFRSEGVKKIWVKIFQGCYDGKRYPRDYTQEQRELLKGLGLNNFEEEILACRVSFLGRKCEAGHRAFSMDISGNVKRCSTVQEKYGNLFDGTFKPGESPRRCPARKCGCSYQGIKYASDKGSTKPPKIIVRSVQLSVAVGEWFDGLTAMALK